jgi:TonB family protein
MRWPQASSFRSRAVGRASTGWALCASALLHFGGVVALSDVSVRARTNRKPPERGFVTDFEPIAEGVSTPTAPLKVSREPPPIAPGGPTPTGALDREQPEGRGGELATLEPSALLFPFVSPLTLQDTELNNLATNQTQRIRTARERATLEERRASPHPADAVLLVSGLRGHEERRDPARRDAADGAPRSSEASAPSTETQVHRVGGGEQREELAREAARLKPALGIAHGRGQAETRAARVSFARPNVDRGAAATPAERVDPSVRDDVDAELLAAKLQRSFVDTSVQRARREGPGSGGVALDPHALGERGAGTGARARPFAPGTGSFDALDTSDARYLRWFTQQRARVQKELVFPRARALAKDQGTSLYRIELGRDGALSGKPRLIRSSGFPDFDAAAAVAIQRALPFAPLPAELAPQLMEIGLLIPVAFSNPMIE